MRPWFDVLGVHEQAPWPLIEHAYLDKWAALKGKAFPTEAEKQQLEELETAFRQAKTAWREKPSTLTDASSPEGTKPVPKPVQSPIKPHVSEERPQQQFEAEVEPEQPVIATRKEEDDENIYLSGCGLAGLFIVGIGVLLVILVGLGVNPGTAGVIIVFVLPVLLFLVDYLKKQK